MSLRKACEDAGLPGLHNETLIFFLSLSFSLPFIFTLSVSLFLFLIYLYVCVQIYYILFTYLLGNYTMVLHNTCAENRKQLAGGDSLPPP